MIINDINPLEIIAAVVTFLTAVPLGLTVYLRNPKSRTHKFFFLLTFVISVYAVINFFSIHLVSIHQPGATFERVLFWIRLDMFVGAFLGPLLFMLVYSFPGRKFTLKKRYLIAVLTLMTATAIASLTPLIFKSMQYSNGNLLPVPGLGMPLYFLDFVGLTLLSFGILILKYRRAIGQEKVRHLYLLLGILATFSIMVVATIIFIVVFKTSVLIFLGPTTTVILAGFIAYAIVKHRFLDIQPIIARAVSFLLFIIILASLYAFILLFVLRKFFDIPFSVFALFITLTVAAVLGFQPIERMIRGITNRIFFKGQYNSDRVLSKLVYIMAGTIDLNSMTQQILSTLTKEMRITNAAFLVVDKHKVIFLQGVGYHDGEFEVPELERLFHIPGSTDYYFSLEDLKDDPTKEIFRKLDISMVMPIRVENYEVALLILGSKSSGEAYSQKDIDLLHIFAPQAGIAIQNAKAYAVIKKFSQVLEQRVRERTSELRRLYEAQSRFMADISHQLQSPLAIMKGNVGLMRRRLKGKEGGEILNMLDKTVDRISHFINDLLTLAKADFGQQKLKKKEVDLNELIKEIYEQSRILAEDRGIDFSMQGSDELVVWGDNDKLRELFLNLISNALEYTQKGSIKIMLRKEDEQAKVEIADTGCGIRQEDLMHIFERFYQVGGEGVIGDGGTGLGLAISKLIVKAHDGTITVKSKLGKGSTFTVSLPIYRG